ncbi:PRD domain-containing protein [Virgibacillus dakarensis]|uniref:Ascorbate-specific PTS system EIIA component n=1 Tax=Lentibacillus populi TaxID=1827502 RepID=A0A9W5X7A2_9BACI|nr:BglG family transcription antiterminator [Lentibacillus populi]MTW84456.1 PRD domain-containing protein [Virgibacillus dakarensis]GGB58671.1 PTS sugar transporter subunit IIC [Lentibacillus populi]
MFDQRSYKLFEEITRHGQTTVSEVMRKVNLSERQFYYDLEKINDALKSVDMPPIKIVNADFIVDNKVKKLVKSGTILDFNIHKFILSEEDRVFLIYLYTFIRKEPVSNYHYQLLTSVSKNTSLSDVKRVKKLCMEWNVELVYSRSDGYHLVGGESAKRGLAFYCIDYLLTQPLGKEIIFLALKTWEQEEDLVLTQNIINEFIEENNIYLVKTRKTEMILHLTFIRVRNKSEELLFNEYEKQLLQRQSLFKYGKKLAHALFDGAENEIYYVTIQLLTALEKVELTENPSLEELTVQIIDAFEKNTLLPIENKDYLKQSLYNHLVPAFFRITFGIPLVNPLTSRIKTKYADLFQFVKRSLAPLSMWTGKKISEEEIGYFTLHFGGYLEKDRKAIKKQVNALIVCSNGVSSSIMLRAQLQEMFPDVSFSRVNTAEQIKAIPVSSYDLVFSTIEVDSIKPVYTVKPLLSQVEKNYLIQAVTSKFPSLSHHHFSVDQLMELIRKHAEIKDEKKLFSELVDLIHQKNTETRGNKPMLSDLLTEDMIQFTDKELGWKEAISTAAQPLVEANKVQKRYVSAMVKKVEEVGTYIHIGNGIAIPHARPEEGVNQIGMSFLRTTTPVKLLDKEEHKIDIFICLAAIDNEAHLKALSHLTRILGDKTALKALKDAKTTEDVIKIIK